MKEERLKLMLTIFGILCIVFLEVLALMKGIDGVVLSFSIAVIALLVPSPAFQIVWKNLKVVKHEEGKKKAD